MTVHIVTDSTADLDAGFRQEHDVAMVPLKVIFGEEEFTDYVDLQPAAFYKRMRESSVHPRTSQPTPVDFEDVFRAVGSDGAPIVCTTISSEMSGTYASARQARASLHDLDIRVVDTRSVGPGHNALAHVAIAAAQRGADADGVVAAVVKAMESLRLLFTVETLEYLKRGGRIGGAAALVGTMLNIKPVLEVRDGRVEPMDRVRTYARALERLVDEAVAAAREWGGASVYVGHADSPDLADTLRARLEAEPNTTVEVSWVGPVIGSHSGPGAFGIAYHRLLG